MLLALDTSTAKGSLALMQDDRVLAELALDAPGAYLQHLLPGVESLLAAAGRRLEEVTAMAVSQGPGNFTGLRLGLATAQGLAWALGCPLTAVSTLEILAAQIPCQPDPIAVLVDAKRQEVYLGLFRRRESEVEVLAAVERLPVTQLPRRLPGSAVLTGPALEVEELLLREILPPGLSWAPSELRYPQAATLARLGRLRLQRGLTIVPHLLQPAYLRPAL